MIEASFGASRPWTVGVEEELMLVDERTLDLVAAAPRLLEGAAEPPVRASGRLERVRANREVPPAARASIKQELLTSVIETTTDICESTAEAAAQLLEQRRRVAKAAAAEGLRVAAAGSHPFARPEDQPVTNDPDYLEFVEAAGPAARRQAVCGLHVHVGMPDADTCVRAHEAALPWLPLVLALSANSPWFRGERSGFASKRAEVLATLPRGGTPPPFASYREWERLMERWVAADVVRRPTQTWWDARVHPALGTLEFRAPDQPTDPALATAFVALLHALGVHAARAELQPASRADYQTNRFFAARFGTRAKLLHPEEDRLATVPQLLDELLERLQAVIDELDAASLLEHLDAGRSEADLQLEAGDAAAATADVVRRSLASPS